ncbi:MAG: hypothetical protein JXQ29_12705 [Planctomycetes bacterium]|nr:hypothetical protein [Planctomycetota bacterium]
MSLRDRTRARSPVPAISEDDVEALARLGRGKRQTRTRVQRAVDAVLADGEALDDGRVLSLALSGA